MTTLRQVQRVLNKSRRWRDAVISPLGRDVTADMTLLPQLVGRRNPAESPKFYGGRLIDTVCDCEECANAADAMDIQSSIDSLVRKYGHNARLADVLAAERPPGGGPKEQNAENTAEASSAAASDATSPGDQPQAGSGPVPATPHPETAPFNAADSAPGAQSDLEEQARLRQERRQKRVDEMQELRHKLKEMASSKKTGSKTRVRRLVAEQKALRNKFKQKRAAVSRVPQAAAPSLQERTMVARACGRLHRVPAWLRATMAQVINKLVANGGTAGEEMSQIPSLHASKLVQRMVSHRPLPGALKEDVCKGRPVTLFLPDISPSCAAQAQISCDIANAAGHAGVAGSDVLVFPHSNGCVEADEDQSYTPWFNGRPILNNVENVAKLFDQLIQGESKYKIRVVICIGDHDALRTYRDVANLPDLTNLIWLHNYCINGSVEPRVVDEQCEAYPLWEPEIKEKLTLVSSCCDQKTIIKGLKCALQHI